MNTEITKADTPIPALAAHPSSIFTEQAFEHAQRVAQVYAKSSMVPDQYRGNVADCLIAMDLAHRLNIDPLMLMQQCYVVNGKPGIEAKLVIALVNARGPFEGPLQFEHEGEGDDRRCTCYATHRVTGEVCRSTVSVQQAKDAGWHGKNPLWRSLTDQMLAYRSAAFFARLYAPECMMGLPTVDEAPDRVRVENTAAGALPEGRTEFGFGNATPGPRASLTEQRAAVARAAQSPSEAEEPGTTDGATEGDAGQEAATSEAEAKPKRKRSVKVKRKAGTSEDEVLASLVTEAAARAGCDTATAAPVVSAWLTRMGWRDRLGEPSVVAVIRAKADKVNWIDEGCIDTEATP